MLYFFQALYSHANPRDHATRTYNHARFQACFGEFDLAGPRINSRKSQTIQLAELPEKLVS